VVSRTSICCAYHVNSPTLGAYRGTVPIKKEDIDEKLILRILRMDRKVVMEGVGRFFMECLLQYFAYWCKSGVSLIVWAAGREA